MATFAEHDINDSLQTALADISKDPRFKLPNYPLTNKNVHDYTTYIARTFGNSYGGKAIDVLKKKGDYYSTFTNFSLGLDDIKPTETKKILVESLAKKVDKAGGVNQALHHFGDIQDALLKDLKSANKPNLSLMIDSGVLSGGKVNQAMKIIATPLAAKRHDGYFGNTFIKHGYSEGLQPDELFTTATEARDNVVEGKNSVSKPGELSKINTNALASVHISMEDCGTHFGEEYPITDTQNIIDHYLAEPLPKNSPYKFNTIIQEKQLEELKRLGIERISVRIPRTCKAPNNNVCQKCWGYSISRRAPVPVNTNVGMQTAQTQAQPLIQMTLSAKHSTTNYQTEGKRLTGEQEVRKLFQGEKFGRHSQVLSEVFGTVKSVTPAPQGGMYIIVDASTASERNIKDGVIVSGKTANPVEVQYYIYSDRTPVVKPMDRVEVGQPLCDGTEPYYDVARLKGIKEGQRSYEHIMNGIYTNAGFPLDPRHFQLSSRVALSKLTVDKITPETRERLSRLGHDIYPTDYMKVGDAQTKLASEAVRVPAQQALGQTLAEDLNGFSYGSIVTETTLKNNPNKQNILVLPNVTLTPHIKGMINIMTKNDKDFLATMNTRFLKRNLEEGVIYGHTAPIEGADNPFNSIIQGRDTRKLVLA